LFVQGLLENAIDDASDMFERAVIEDSGLGVVFMFLKQSTNGRLLRHSSACF